MTSISAYHNGINRDEFERRVDEKVAEGLTLERRLSRIEVQQEMFFDPGGVCDRHAATTEAVRLTAAKASDDATTELEKVAVKAEAAHEHSRRVEKRVIWICAAATVVMFIINTFGPKLIRLIEK